MSSIIYMYDVDGSTRTLKNPGWRHSHDHHTTALRLTVVGLSRALQAVWYYQCSPLYEAKRKSISHLALCIYHRASKAKGRLALLAELNFDCQPWQRETEILTPDRLHAY